MRLTVRAKLGPAASVRIAGAVAADGFARKITSAYPEQDDVATRPDRVTLRDGAARQDGTAIAHARSWRVKRLYS